MFVPAPDATVAADGTATTPTGKSPWLLRCDTCPAIATNFVEDEVTGDGWRYPTRDLADLDHEDRKVLGYLGWHLTDHGHNEPRQYTVVCYQCAQAAGVGVLESAIEDERWVALAESLISGRVEKENEELREANTTLQRQVRRTAGAVVCLAAGAAVLLIGSAVSTWFLFGGTV